MGWKFYHDWSVSYPWDESPLIPALGTTWRIDQRFTINRAPYQARAYLIFEIGTDTLGLFPLQAIAFPAIKASTVFEIRIPEDLKNAGFHVRKVAASHNPGARRWPDDNWVIDLYYWQP